MFALTPGDSSETRLCPQPNPSSHRPGGGWISAIIVVLLLALGYFAFDKFALAPRCEAANVVEATKAAEAK